MITAPEESSRPDANRRSLRQPDKPQFLRRFRHPLAYCIQWIAMLGMLLQPLPLTHADGSAGITITDTDGDGMSDSWESSYGLNPNDPTDAFQDADGDRVPNLWEYQNGTDPTDASSAPSPEIIVDGSQPTDATVSRYATLQEAYDASAALAIDGVSPHYGYIAVRPGVYTAGVDGATAPKKLLWLADTGGQVILYSSGAAMVIADEAVVDGFTLMGDGFVQGPGIVVQPPQSSTAPPEVRIVNSIVSGRNGSSDTTWSSAGGVLNNGGDLWLVQDTLVNNYGASADALLNQSGTTHLVNSVVGWQGAGSTSAAVVDACSGLTVQNSIIIGMAGAWGSWPDDPMLTGLGGHLTAQSSACLARGAVGAGVVVDLYGQARYAIAPDLGAEQWVSSYASGLPDWYGQRMVAAGYVGSINYVLATTDYSGDGRSALQEFQRGVLPGQSPLTNQVADTYSLTVGSGQASLAPGQTTTLNAQLLNTTRGTPVVGAAVNFSVVVGDGQVNSSSTSATPTATATTDSNGNCSVTFTAGFSASQVSVQDGNGYGTSSSINLSPHNFSLEFWSEHNSLNQGQSTMLHARLWDTTTGTVLTGSTPVNFIVASGSGSLNTYTAYPDSGGTYSVTFYSNGADQEQINAWDGGGYQTSSNCMLSVNSVDTTSPTYSLSLFADSSSLTPGQTTTLYAHLNPAQSGVPINFSMQSGNGALGTTSTATDSDGIASVTFTGGWNASVVNVADGWSLASANSFGFAVNTPVPDNYSLTIGSNPGAVETGKSTTVTATLTDKTTNTAVPNATLYFSVSSGDGLLSASYVTTDSSGSAEVTLNGGVTASQVNVSDDNGYGTSSTTWVAVQAPLYQLTLSAAQSTLVPGSSTMLTAQLTVDGVPVSSSYPLYFSISPGDGFLNNTPGQQTFSTYTDATGRWTLPFTSGWSNSTISVWDVAGLSTSYSLTINVNQISLNDNYLLSTWTEDSALAAGSGTALNAQLVYKSTQTPIIGATLNFTVNSTDPAASLTDPSTGTAGLSSVTATTDGTGTCVVTFTGGAADATVQVADGNSLGTSTTNFFSVVNDGYSVTLSSSAPQLNQGTNATIYATLKNTTTQQAVSGATLNFSTTGGDGTFSGEITATATTGSNGQAQIQFTGGTIPTTVTVVDGNSLGTSCSLTQDLIGNYSLSLTPDYLSVSPGGTTAVRAVLTDSNNQPVPNATVNFTTNNSGDGTFGGSITASATTDPYGNCSVTFTGGNNATQVFAADGTGATASCNIGVVIGHSYILNLSAQSPLSQGQSVPVTAQVLDNTGAPVSGVLINFSVVSGDGWLSSSSGWTDSYGCCSITFTAVSTQSQINAWDSSGYQTSSSCTLSVNWVGSSGGGSGSYGSGSGGGSDGSGGSSGSGGSGSSGGSNGSGGSSGSGGSGSSGGSDGSGGGSGSGQTTPSYALSLSAEQSTLVPGQRTTLHAILSPFPPYAGIPITFSINYGDGHLSTLSATTDANGVANVTFTGGWNATQVNVADGWGWASANSYGFSVNTGTSDYHTLTAWTDPGTLVPGDTTTVYATLTDLTTGTLIPGASLEFSIYSGDGTFGGSTSTSAITDDTGTASVTLTVGKSSSQVNVGDLNYFGTGATTTVAVLQPVYTLTLSAPDTALAPGSTTLVTAQLTATLNGISTPVDNNTPIQFALNSTSDGSLYQPGLQSYTAYTDANGLCSMPFTSGVSNTTISVWAWAGITASDSLTINVNQVSTSDGFQLITWADATALGADADTTLHAQVVDTRTNTPVEGFPLSFTVSSSDASATLTDPFTGTAQRQVTATTGSTGTCVVNFNSGAATATVQAADTYSLNLATTSYFNVVNDSYALILTSSAQQLPHGGNATIYATLQNNTTRQPVSGATLNFSTTGGDGIFSGNTTTTTDSSGQAQIQFIGGTIPTTVTVADGNSLGASYSLTQDVIGDYLLSLSAADPSVSPGGTTTVRALLTDNNNQPVPNVTVNFSIVTPGGDGTLSDDIQSGCTQITATTDPNGKCFVTFTGGNNATQVAAADGEGATASCSIGVAIGHNYDLSFTQCPASLAPEQYAQVTAQLLDNKTPVVGANVVFSVTGGGTFPSGSSTSTTVSATTDNTGRCTVTLYGGATQSVISAAVGADLNLAASSSTITIPDLGPLAITTTNAQMSASPGLPFSVTIAAGGGTGSYTWESLTGSNGSTLVLPAGLTASADNKTIQGKPTANGSCSFTATVSDGVSIVSKDFLLTVSDPLVISDGLANPVSGQPYSQPIGVSGGYGNVSFNLVGGRMPNGIGLASDGTLAGTTTESGSFSFRVSATDEAGHVAEQGFTFSIAKSPDELAIATTSLPPGVLGQSYSASVSASGGSGSYTFSGSGGGLTVASDGSISGTLTQSGSFSVAVTVTDAANTTNIASATLQGTANVPVVSLIGDRQVVKIGKTPAPVTVSITAGGGGLAGVTVSMSSQMGTESKTTDASGCASFDLPATTAAGACTYSVSAAGTGCSGSYYTYEVPAASTNPPPDILPGPPPDPTVTPVNADDDVVVESRWISISSGTVQADWWPQWAIYYESGQYIRYYGGGGSPNYYGPVANWKCIDGQWGNGPPPDMNTMPWSMGLTQGFDCKYLDTAEGPVSPDHDDTGGIESQFPDSIKNAPGVVLFNGFWIGKSVGRGDHTTAQVRIRRKTLAEGGSGKTDAVTMPFLDVTSKIATVDGKQVETIVSCSPKTLVINEGETESQQLVTLSPSAAVGEVKIERLAAIEKVSRDKYFAGSITIPDGWDSLELEFVNTSSSENLGKYGQLDGTGTTKVYNSVEEVLDVEGTNAGEQPDGQQVWFIRNSQSANKINWYTCFNDLGTVDVKLYLDGAQIGSIQHQLIAEADFAGWITYVDQWVKGTSFQWQVPLENLPLPTQTVATAIAADPVAGGMASMDVGNALISGAILTTRANVPLAPQSVSLSSGSPVTDLSVLGDLSTVRVLPQEMLNIQPALTLDPGTVYWLADSTLIPLTQAQLEELLPQAGSVTLAAVPADQSQNGGATNPNQGGNINQGGNSNANSGNLNNLTRAALIPVFNVIAQIEGMEAVALGLFDGVKAGLQDDWILLCAIGRGSIIAKNWSVEAVAAANVEIQKWRTDPKKRAAEFKALAKNFCKEMVFKPMQDAGDQLAEDFSSWDKFKQKAWAFMENLDRFTTTLVDVQFRMLTKDMAGPQLADGLTSWADDFSQRMMVQSEYSAFANAPWRKDELIGDLIAFGRERAYTFGYMEGYLVEQVFLGGAVVGTAMKIGKVLVRGGISLATGLVLAYKTSFQVGARMHLIKKWLAGAVASAELRLTIERGFTLATRAPIANGSTDLIIDIVESAYAREGYDRTLFGMSQTLDELLKAPNILNLSTLPAREHQFWHRYAVFFEFLKEQASANAAQGYIRAYSRVLKFEGGLYKDDRFLDLLGALKADTAEGAALARESLERFAASTQSAVGKEELMLSAKVAEIYPVLYHYKRAIVFKFVKIDNGVIKITAAEVNAAHYLTPECLTSSASIVDRMQLPTRNLTLTAADRARYRFKITTSSIQDNVRIPYAYDYEKRVFRDWLEPVCRDHPKYGMGGAVQFTTSSEMIVEEVFDATLGRVLTQSEIQQLINAAAP